MAHADQTTRSSKSSGQAASKILASASSTGTESTEEDILSKLPQSKPKKRRPGQAWDGRVAGISLKEYRERKWSLEASFSKVERRGPAYSCRGPCLVKSKSATDVILETDVYKAFNKTQPVAPTWSASLASFPHLPESSQGPAQYQIPGTLDPSGHPMYPRELGAKFGTERLLAHDEPSPAPGDHNVGNYELTGRYKKQPNYSITGREAWRPSTKPPGPSMGEYQFDNMTRTGKMTPIKWNMQGKTEIADAPTGAGQVRLRKKVDAAKRKMKFEVELEYKKVAPMLLNLEGPQLTDAFAALSSNSSLVRDPNTFLVSTAMKFLGGGAATGSQSVSTPGPGHFSFVSVPKERSPQWRFGSENRGLA